MQIHFKTFLALAFVVSLPLHLRATPQSTSGEPLTAKQVRKAEAEAKTAQDHLRLAAYYQAKAQQTQSKLADAEDQMKHWSFMEGRTKVPNAYTSSRSLVERYRAEFEEASKLAANHQKMAESLRASTQPAR
jgi:hypothetical protein